MLKWLFIGAVFLSCGTVIEQQKLSGHYGSTRRSAMQKMFGSLAKYESGIVGSSLSLNEDSGFVYKSCGNLMSGTWTVKNDSVFLKIDHNEYRSDSLIRTGEVPALPLEPVSFKMMVRGKGEILLYRAFDQTLELLGRKND